MFAGEVRREVVLPRGKWYDFYSGAYAGEAEIITVTPGLEQIPVFVRDGGIVPMIEPRRQVPQPDEAVDLEVRHYGNAEGAFRLYDDDGATFAYERGAYAWTELVVARSPDGTLNGAVRRPDQAAPFHYDTIRWRFMTP
jgi:alpha-D-xyloside xylohydrolase